jgi:pyrroloquinoline quinone (PQQ) biosynthesis protein C
MTIELLHELKAHKKRHIDCHPIFARLAAGDFTRFHYLAYLRETYHLVKHTPKYLTIAADRVAETDERLSAYFRKFSGEETGHELLCVKDIKALGQNAEEILASEPNPGAWGMITQCYFWASHGNPIALLGDAFATEELGHDRGGDVATVLEESNIPRQATNFLRVHGSEDKKHLEEAFRAIEWYAADSAHVNDISYATRMTYRNYGQLFTDVLEMGDAGNKVHDSTDQPSEPQSYPYRAKYA